jgi:hypothetical protein
MSWLGWSTNDDGSESNTKEVSSDNSRSGNAETQYLSTAGGGDKENHTHIIIQHKEGRDTAECLPHKNNRK